MAPRAFTPQRPTRPKILHTTTEWHLHYVSTWSLSQYAPNSRRLPTALALDPHTGAFLICSYQLQQKTWKLVGIVDPATVHAYITDNRTRVRVLGWGDAESRTGLKVYWDLQFVEEDELQRFLDRLDRNVEMVFKSAEQTASTMIQLYRQVPEKAAVMSQSSLVKRVLEPYLPPTMRDYQPQYARLGSPAVQKVIWKPETGGLFDGYTQKMEDDEEVEVEIPRWNGVIPKLGSQRHIQASVILSTSKNHSRQASHKPISHEPEIVDDQLEQPLEKHNTLVNDETDEDPEEVFAFVYDDVASQDVHSTRSNEEGEIDKSAEVLTKDNVRRNRVHSMPGYVEEQILISPRIPAGHNNREEHSRVPTLLSLPSGIIRKTAQLEQRNGTELQVGSQLPIEFRIIDNEPHQKDLQARSELVEEELLVVEPATTKNTIVTEKTQSKNEQERKGEVEVNMLSTIHSSPAKELLEQPNQTFQASTLDPSEHGSQAKEPPTDLQQAQDKAILQVSKLSQRSMAMVDMPEDHSMQQRPTQTPTQTHEQSLVSAMEAQHDRHDAVPENEHSAHGVAKHDAHVAQEPSKMGQKRPFDVVEDVEGSREATPRAQVVSATPRRQSSRIQEKSRIARQDVPQSDSGRPPKRPRVTANDYAGEISGLRSGEASESQPTPNDLAAPVVNPEGLIVASVDTQMDVLSRVLEGMGTLTGMVMDMKEHIAGLRADMQEMKDREGGHKVRKAD